MHDLTTAFTLARAGFGVFLNFIHANIHYNLEAVRSARAAGEAGRSAVE